MRQLGCSYCQISTFSCYSSVYYCHYYYCWFILIWCDGDYIWVITMIYLTKRVMGSHRNGYTQIIGWQQESNLGFLTKVKIVNIYDDTLDDYQIESHIFFIIAYIIDYRHPSSLKIAIQHCPLICQNFFWTTIRRLFFKQDHLQYQTWAQIEPIHEQRFLEWLPHRH